MFTKFSLSESQIPVGLFTFALEIFIKLYFTICQNIVKVCICTSFGIIVLSMLHTVSVFELRFRMCFGHDLRKSVYIVVI